MVKWDEPALLFSYNISGKPFGAAGSKYMLTTYSWKGEKEGADSGAIRDGAPHWFADNNLNRGYYGTPAELGCPNVSQRIDVEGTWEGDNGVVVMDFKSSFMVEAVGVAPPELPPEVGAKFDDRGVIKPPAPNPRKSKIVGDVIDEQTGQPIETAYLSGSGPTPFDVYTVHGLYSTPDLDPGSYTLECRADKYQSKTATVQVPENQFVVVNFALSLRAAVVARIKGKVTDKATGELIHEGLVSGSGPTPFQVPTVEGNYDSGELNPGSYTIQFSQTNYKTETRSLVLSPGESRTLDVELERVVSPTQGEIVGYVRDKATRKVVDGATVDLTPGELTTSTSPMGYYEFKPLEPGEYELTASHPDYSSETKTVMVTAGSKIVLDFDLESTAAPPVGPCATVGEGLPWPFNVVARALCEAWHAWVDPVIEAIAKIEIKFPTAEDLATGFWNLLPEWLRATIDTAKTVLDGSIRFGRALITTRKSEAPPGYVNLDTDQPPQYVPQPQEKAGVGLFGGIAREMARAIFGDFDQQAPGLVSAAKVVVSPSSPEWKTELETELDAWRKRLEKETKEKYAEVEAKHSPITIEAAKEIWDKIPPIAMSALTAAIVADVAGEFGTVGQVEALGKAARQILKHAGIMKISGEITTAPVRYGIMPWLGRHFDSVFRTHIFERDLADELYIKGEIDQKTWKQIYAWYGFPEGDITHIENELKPWPITRLADQMLFHKEISLEKWQLVYRKAGWRDEYRDAWHESMWTNPSDRLIMQMFEIAQEEKEWFTEQLTNRGYSDKNAEKLISNFNKLTTRDELKSVMTELVTEFAQGFSSEPLLTSALEKLQRPKEEITQRVELAKLKAERDRRATERRLLREKFVKLVIQEAEYRAGLAKLGMQPDRIETEIQLAKLDRKGQVERALTKADQESLFRFKIIDEPAYRVRLAGLGYDAQEIEDLVALAKARAPAAPELKPLELTKSDIEDLFTTGKRTEAWARSKLQEMQAKDQTIEDLMDLWKTRLPKPPEPKEAELTKDEVMSLQGYGMIEDPEFASELTAKGYPAAAIDRLHDLSTVRAIQDERLKLRQQAEYDYLDGFTSYELLLVNLEALLFRSDEVQMFASAAKQKLDRDHKRKLIEIATLAYRKDLITEDEFTKYLKDEIKLQEDKITLILEEENLRKVPAPKRR